MTRIEVIGNPWISFGISLLNHSSKKKCDISLMINLPFIILWLHMYKKSRCYMGTGFFERSDVIKNRKRYCKSYKWRIRTERYKHHISLGFHIDETNPHIELFFLFFKIDIGYLPTMKEYVELIKIGQI